MPKALCCEHFPIFFYPYLVIHLAKSFLQTSFCLQDMMCSILILLSYFSWLFIRHSLQSWCLNYILVMLLFTPLAVAFLSPFFGIMEYILDLSPTNSKIGFAGLSSLNLPGIIMYFSLKFSCPFGKLEKSNQWLFF